MDLVKKVLHLGVSGGKHQNAELRTFVKSIDTNAICVELETLMDSTNLNIFLEHIFSACNCDEEWAQQKKAKVLIKCLKLLHLQNETIETQRYKQVVSLIQLNIKNGMIKPDQLIKICSMLLKHFEKPDVKYDCCTILIPSVLQEISKYNKLDYLDDIMGDKEYPAEAIQKLKDMKWTNSNIILLADMFLNIQLTPEENRQIVLKFADCIESLDSDTIPALVYHLLKLASSNDSHVVLLKLQQYFGRAIYDVQSYVGSVNSESCTEDRTLEKSQMKLIECESNVFLHISTDRYSRCVQKYLEFLKNSAKLYEFVLHPFNFSLLLIIATDHNMPEWLDVIKSAMICYYIEEDMRERCFFRELFVSRLDMGTVIKQVIDTSCGHRDSVINGIVKLSVLLLTSGVQIGREDVLVRLSRIATFILIRIIDTRNNMAKSILMHLITALKSAQNAALLMDSFITIATKFKYNTIKNNSHVLEIFQDITLKSNYEANAYFDLMMNLSHQLPRIKEHAIALLQKSFRAEKLESQLNMVTLYQKMLKHLKVSSHASLSQESEGSQVSLSTQISMSRIQNTSSSALYSNEAICREVIEGLQRIFRMRVEAIVSMCKSVSDIVEKNPELKPSLWMFFWQAFMEMLKDDEVLPNYENICKIEGSDWVLLRSVSQVTMTLALLLVDATETEILDDEEKFKEIASAMINCDVEHFILDQDLILNDGSAEAQAQMYIIHEVINTYDAFITYFVLQWSLESHNAEIVKNLFKAQKRMADYLRHYQRTKKKDLSVSKSTTANTTRATGSNKKLKLPNSIIPLHCLNRAIEILYRESVPWAEIESAKTLKVLVSFHHYILEAFISTCTALKQNKSFPNDKAPYWQENFNSIQECLYDNGVKKFEYLLEFDLPTAALVLEGFHQVLIIRQDMHEKLENSWENIFVKTNNKAIDFPTLKGYINTFQELLTTFEAIEENDHDRIVLAIVNTIAQLAGQIPLDEKQFAKKLTDWMKITCRDKILPSKIAANNFVACLIKTSMRFSISALVLRLLVSALGAAMGWNATDISAEGSEFAMINKTSSVVVLQTVLKEIKNHRDDISWILTRIKLDYEYSILSKAASNTTAHRSLKHKERSICSKLLELVTLLTQINQLSDHRQTEKILQTSILILKLLTALTNHFTSTSTPTNLAFQVAGFDGLVRHTMKKLVTEVYKKIDPDEGLPQGSNIRSTPSLVLEIEILKKAIMRLSSKTKVEVYDNLGIGKVRGFRVNDLEKYIGQQEQSADTEMLDVTEQSDDEEDTPDVPVTNKRKKN